MGMVTVSIKDLHGHEEREFDILDRETIEDIIDNTNVAELYKVTYREALARGNESGTVRTYISAKDGKIYTHWLKQGTYNHTYDSFYEIVLCKVSTPQESLDTMDYLNEDEYSEYKEGVENLEWGTLEEYAEINGIDLEDRLDDILDWYAEKYGNIYGDDIDVIGQLYNLYDNQIGCDRIEE